MAASPRPPAWRRAALPPAPFPTRSRCGAAAPPPAVADAVLGIETSCDETSAAVLLTGGLPPAGRRWRVGSAGAPPFSGTGGLASLVILSQDIHKVFGGVVPELASR